jgi:DNA-binding response OmpR family regulator
LNAFRRAALRAKGLTKNAAATAFASDELDFAAMTFSKSGVAPVHVLFVEDEFLISEWVAQALSEQGFCVQALRCDPVDVLFTDINLPGDMDGAALARRAREMQPHLPVVYASACCNSLQPVDQVPGSCFVPKPYEPAVVGRLLTAMALKASTPQASAEHRVPA